MPEMITRYRPKTLQEVLGNDAAKNRWLGYVKRRDFPHSIILVGPFGTGKTTMAPIFCEDIMRIVPPNMKGLMGPRLRKLGPADYQYERMVKIVSDSYEGLSSPIVMFLDEAHRMTETKIQELFLNPIEDNDNLYCVFATAEIGKINPALIKRSTVFALKRPSMDVLVPRMAEIAKIEKIPISSELLVFLIEQADCIPRDCLKLLECLCECEDPITKEVVESRISDNISAMEQ